MDGLLVLGFLVGFDVVGGGVGLSDGMSVVGSSSGLMVGISVSGAGVTGFAVGIPVG